MSDANLHPLRVARFARNLTIEQLAEEAKVGASTIWRAEHNYPINAESRRRLCVYLGMSSQELGFCGKPRHSPHKLVFIDPSPQQGDDIPTTITADMLNSSALREKQPGNILLLQARELIPLLNDGWSLETLMESLYIVLQSIQDISCATRKELFRGSEIVRREQLISEEERARICNALDKSIAQSWQFFHIASPGQVLAVSQAQLQLVRHLQSVLPRSRLAIFYAATYNLIGAAFHSLGHYPEAQRTHEQAYAAALEGGDIWNQAQSLNWQAIDANVQGYYRQAMIHIEAALHLLTDKEDKDFLRLRAHLLADWAYNASLLQEQHLAQQKLADSANFLRDLDPNEEFDQARWHQLAGDCDLLDHRYDEAINHLEQALTQIPAQWLTRRLLTLIPLAEAYARKNERDQSIAMAKQAATVLSNMNSPMLQRRFAAYQHTLSELFPEDRQVKAFLTSTVLS